MNQARRKKVMVFGVFDGVHDGHRAFVKEAKQFGTYLIAVVTPDHIVEYFKKRYPRYSVAERFAHLRSTEGVDAVVVGDSVVGTWNVLDLHRPHVIVLGHDQHAMFESLKNYFRTTDWRPEIRMASRAERGAA